MTCNLVEMANTSENSCYETLAFPDHVCCIRFMAEWLINNPSNENNSHSDDNLCDLDLKIFCYDDRARFIEKLDGSNSISKDSSCELISDIESTETKDSYFELAKVNLSKVDPSTTAILFYMDGGSRNFNLVQKIICSCRHTPNDRKDESASFSQLSYQNEKLLTFEKLNTTDNEMKKYDGLALCLLYKVENDDSYDFSWCLKSLMEPIFTPEIVPPSQVNFDQSSPNNQPASVVIPVIHKSKFDICLNLVIKNIPSLEKFKPRLFSNVRDVCAALSSQALPNLKKTFQHTSKGLNISQFTKAIFNQLATTHPAVMEESEAASTVALIQEMFQQIDYNGDHFTDWDEFTTFCIQTGVVTSNESAEDENKQTKKNGMIQEEISITYCEDAVMRDRSKFVQRHILAMKYMPQTRKLAIVAEGADYIYIFDEQFRQISKFSPLNIIVQGALNDVVMMPADKKVPFQIYDVVHIPSRDMYAFCMSDHTIIICREQVTLGGLNVKYTCFNKMYHMLLHKKLCWSESSKILCSVCSDNTIYGWDLELNSPIFQIVRHTDVITDFIAVDHLDMFITCSMDKRIMCWSASTRRVKYVMMGHHRGVRSLSCFENTLLSAGFESEARTWDLKKKEPVAILKGHRFPIVVAKLMCEKATNEREHRAVTVDEQGEMRLWDIYVSERLGESVYVPTLQVFSINNPEPPLCDIRFIEFPYSPHYSVGYYSNIIACSTKLLNFNPEKNVRDFLPPTCSCFNESSGVLATAVGKDILQYDICTGRLIKTLSNVHTSEITALCLDGMAGRRMYVGCSNGELLLVNFMSGSIISSISNAHSKEIVNISLSPSSTDGLVCVYTGSADGNICLIDETGGQLSLRNSIENAFGLGVAVECIKHIDYANAIVASSSNKQWGVWVASTLKKVSLNKETTRIHAVQCVRLYHDVVRIDSLKDSNETSISSGTTTAFDPSTSIMKTYAIVAIALDDEILLYSVDFSKLKAIPFKSTRSGTNSLSYATIKSTIVCLDALKSMDLKTIKHKANHLIAAYEDGTIQIWDINACLDTTAKLARKRHSIINIPSVKTSSQDDTHSIPPSGKQSQRDSVVDESITSFWKGHHDHISAIVPLHDHSSFVTVSLDGYHKIWSASEHDKCLGELPLPNLTDIMKEKWIRSNANRIDGFKWKFVLDRAPVTPAQETLAKLLVNQFLNPRFYNSSVVTRKRRSSIDSNQSYSSISKTNFETKYKHISPHTQSPESTLNSLVRSKALLSLKDSQSGDLTAFENRSDKMDFNQTNNSSKFHSTQSSNNQPDLGSTKSSLDPIDGKLNTMNDSSMDSSISFNRTGVTAFNTSQRKHKKKNLTPLWSTSQQLVNVKGEQMIKAFSDTSLNHGRINGYINSEEFTLLRSLSNDPSKITVYNSATPTLFLRNPKQSTCLKIPKLSEVSTAEVSFGAQAELFKNAEKYLNDRSYKVGKEQELRTIVMGRIELNIKHVGEMVHREITRSHDEILLPADVEKNHMTDDKGMYNESLQHNIFLLIIITNDM